MDKTAPLDTPARVCAERLYILTESLSDAVLNERFEEIESVLLARQHELGLLGSYKLDSVALAILDRVKAAERELIALAQRTQGSAAQELAHLFRGSQNVKAYRQPAYEQNLSRTG